MLLARLFRSLDRPTDTLEAPTLGTLPAPDRLKAQGFREHAPSRRQQSGGAVRQASSISTLGMYSGIIPKTGVFIP